jgi:sugar phosphate isomerase/epimerase
MQIGYQLYSALERCQTADGLKKTIREIADIGYHGVEFFSYAGIPADELKSVLAQAGVAGLNSHVSLDRWQNNLDGELEYARLAGIPTLTIPWLAPELRNTGTYEAIAKNVPGWLARCKEAGIAAAYHNHDFEYAVTDGQEALPGILGADEGLLFELDTFWAMFAGKNPVEEMERWKNRLALIHIKDYTDLGTTPPTFCAVGHGKMDNTPIVEKARQLSVPWVVVEQDNSPIDVIDSARLSFETLSAYKL